MSITEKLKTNFPLASLTTFKVGGEAELFLELTNKEELREAYEWAQSKQKAIYVLGGGSNMLIADQGIKGLVLKMSNTDIILRGERLECGAGANLNRALYIASGNNLSGLEWVAGIPGATVGGAIRGNAGAFGTTVASTVENVEAFDLNKGSFVIFSNKDCAFAYRRSYFSQHSQFVIWEAILRLKKGEKKDINSEIQKILDYRRSQQPNLPSAGSIFKNFDFETLKNKNSALAQEAETAGAVIAGQVAAGWLIEKAGFKGKKMGNAKVSLEHANFIVNTGHATAEDIYKLINLIKNYLKINYQIELEEEVKLLGF